jgi:hypothetical protein
LRAEWFALTRAVMAFIHALDWVDEALLMSLSSTSTPTAMATTAERETPGMVQTGAPW